MGPEASSQLPTPPESRLLNRRTFTKALLGSAALYGNYRLGSQDHQPSCISEAVESPEVSSRLLIIDFTPDDCDPRIHQDVRFTNEQLLDHLAKRFLDSNNKQAFQVAYEALSSIGLGGILKEKFLEYNPQFASAAGRLDDIKDHGEGVAHVIRETLGENGIRITPTMYPIQRTYDYIRSSVDAEGNDMWLVGTSTDKIIAGIARYPDQEIVNLSWQVGEVGVVIKDAADTILGAYRKEAAYENLSKLATICNAFPDKLFIVAAGNHGDDLREGKAQLIDEKVWPKNVIVAGEWEITGENTGRPMQQVYGADVYVDKGKFWNGSTVSTAQITAHALLLRSRGYKPEAIREIILGGCSDEVMYVVQQPREVFPGYALPFSLERSRKFNPDAVSLLINATIPAAYRNS